MAQYRVGMAHFRMMAKADRDQTEARLAEVELKEFMVKYPEDPLTIRAKARLREAQEVLAEGEFETASFYLMRGAYRAARGRYKEIIEKYPNFSEGDQALFGMGQCLDRMKIPKESIPYYSRLLRDFPLSPHVDEAKARLVAMGQPVPKPTKATLARAQADATRVRSKSLLDKLALSMSGTPDTSVTLRGPVELGATASGVELAKRVPNAPGIANASIIASPVSDSSLGSGKTDESKPAAGNSTSTGTSKNEAPAKTEETPSSNDKPSPNPATAAPEAKATENQTPAKTDPAKAKSTSQDQPANSAPQKKKGKFHVFKKLVPF